MQSFSTASRITRATSQGSLELRVVTPKAIPNYARQLAPSTCYARDAFALRFHLRYACNALPLRSAAPSESLVSRQCFSRDSLLRSGSLGCCCWPQTLRRVSFRFRDGLLHAVILENKRNFFLKKKKLKIYHRFCIKIRP